VPVPIFEDQRAGAAGGLDRRLQKFLHP
jgi:hypothetical protein